MLASVRTKGSHIKSLQVKNCPCCNSTHISRSVLDWNKLLYHFCGNCQSAYLASRINFEYDDNYWGVISDPDGNVRDLSKERDQKIRNWYGDTVAFVNNLKPGRVLDVGAGLGFFLSALNNDWDKYAIEISEYAALQIKELYDEISVLNVSLNESLYKNDFFDVIMFYHVIEHLEDPEKELKKLYQILKPGGLLIIGTPNISSLASKIFRGNFRLYGPGHICLFNQNSLNSLLLTNNFKIFKREFPYWKTDYATVKNFFRMFMPWKVSPPFYGSIMTFYAHKI
jgi:2-polyprenyl-3-methyl-5-hydroxy-6-metoxy-1,4-benzoquinol methylase